MPERPIRSREPFYSQTYDLLGREIGVRSVSLEVLSILDRIFERHVSNAPAALTAPTAPGASPAPDASTAPGAPNAPTLANAPCEVVIHSGAGCAEPQVQVAGRSVRIPFAEAVSYVAHLVLLNVAAAGAVGLNVLHGAALERDGRALLIVGRSGFGKTTLTLELVRRGWRFLSDDLAPVNGLGEVLPFPRRINATAESLRLVGLPIPETPTLLATLEGVPKLMVSAEECFGECAGESASVKHVVILTVQAEATTTRHGERSGEWTFLLDRDDEGLVDEVGAVPGVLSVSKHEAAFETTSDRARRHAADKGGAVLLRVGSEPGSRLIAELDALLARREVTILQSRREGLFEPAFSGGSRPRETDLRHHPETGLRHPREADLRHPRETDLRSSLATLIAHDLGLSGRRYFGLSETTDLLQSTARLHGALARAGARLFELTPGALVPTADAIEALVD